MIIITRQPNGDLTGRNDQPGSIDQRQRDLLFHAAAAFGFIINRNESITLPAFADRIDSIYRNPRAQFITNELRSMVK